MELSCLRFKQSKNSAKNMNLFYWVFCNFWVIFGYIWQEIVFLKGFVTLQKIRNIEDLM